MPKQKKSTKKFIRNKLDKELEKRKAKKVSYKKKKKEEVPVVEEEEQDSDYSDTAGFINNDNKNNNIKSDNENETESETETESGSGSGSGSELGEDGEEEEEDYDPEEFQAELKKLQDTDASFYNFLKENDNDLLNFKSDSDNEQEPDQEEQILSKQEILILRNSIKKNNSILSLKKLMVEFKRVVNFDENAKYEMKLFNLIILLVLRHTPQVLQYHLGEKPTESPNWKKLRHLTKVYLTNIMILLKTMKQMTIFILKNFQPSLKYTPCFPKIQKDLQKQLVQLWSTGSEKIKISAFLSIRKSVMQSQATFDSVFKLMYQQFLEVSRNTTQHSFPTIQFMDNCIVEIAGLSLSMSYQHCFTSLRSIAMQLRTASMGKTPNSFKVLYNWQCFHALKLWSHVLCTFCDPDLGPKESSVMHPLIYPLVQIMIGIMGAKHFPLRLMIVNLLIEISKKTKVFIPVGSHLLSIFESSEMKNKGKPSTLKPLDFKLNIRAPNMYLGSKSYHNSLVDQLMNYLYDYFNVYATSICFPELTVPTIVQLKRLIKNSTDYNLNKQVGVFLEKLEENSRFVVSKRQGVEFGPKDVVMCLDFVAHNCPFQKYYEQRKKIKERQVVKEEMVYGESDDEPEEDTLESGDEVEDGMGMDSDEEVCADKKGNVGAKKPETQEYEDDGMEEDLVEDFEMSD